ncbi:hypothetical protein HC256_008976 [Beauveria bassiana]|nr:hypothetical protein HC256_008976 [Beauveria bassiana]
MASLRNIMNNVDDDAQPCTHIRTLPSPLQLAIFSIIFLRLAAAGKAEATNLWAFRIRTANRMVQALTCAR